jgi:hypothetical protein
VDNTRELYAALDQTRRSATAVGANDVAEWATSNRRWLADFGETIKSIGETVDSAILAVERHGDQGGFVRQTTHDAARALDALMVARRSRRDVKRTTSLPAAREVATKALIEVTDTHEDAVEALESAEADYADSGGAVVDTLTDLVGALEVLAPEPGPVPLTLWRFERPEGEVYAGDPESVIVAAEDMTSARELAEKSTGELWGSPRASVHVFGTTVHVDVPQVVLVSRRAD